MNTGDRIKQRRLELGLTVDDLAEKIGKSRATIYRYENGDIENMPTPILEPLAKALDTTPADLMGWQSSSISSLHNNIHCENIAESELVLSYRKLNKPISPRSSPIQRAFSPLSRWRKNYWSQMPHMA